MKKCITNVGLLNAGLLLVSVVLAACASDPGKVPPGTSVTDTIESRLKCGTLEMETKHKREINRPGEPLNPQVQPPKPDSQQPPTAPAGTISENGVPIQLEQDNSGQLYYVFGNAKYPIVGFDPRVELPPLPVACAIPISYDGSAVFGPDGSGDGYADSLSIAFALPIGASLNPTDEQELRQNYNVQFGVTRAASGVTIAVAGNPGNVLHFMAALGITASTINTVQVGDPSTVGLRMTFNFERKLISVWNPDGTVHSIVPIAAPSPYKRVKQPNFSATHAQPTENTSVR